MIKTLIGEEPFVVKVGESIELTLRSDNIITLIARMQLDWICVRNDVDNYYCVKYRKDELGAHDKFFERVKPEPEEVFTMQEIRKLWSIHCDYISDE